MPTMPSSARNPTSNRAMVDCTKKRLEMGMPLRLPEFCRPRQRICAKPGHRAVALEPASILIGRIEGADGGQRSLVSLALDHRHLSAATLREPRGADVAGEH